MATVPFLFLLFLNFIKESFGQTCPAGCSCTWSDPGSDTIIVDCTFANFSSLSEIDLSVVIDPIEKLLIAHNNIEVLSAPFFDNALFRSLNLLDLSYNRISVLGSNVFDSTAFQYFSGDIDLRHNSISIIWEDLKTIVSSSCPYMSSKALSFDSFPTLRFMNFQGNPIDCIQSATALYCPYAGVFCYIPTKSSTLRYGLAHSPPGKYISLAANGTQALLSCPDSTFQPASGRFSCNPASNCSEGTYMSRNYTSTSDRVCPSCVLGETYQDKHNQLSCLSLTNISVCGNDSFFFTPVSLTHDTCASSCPSGYFYTTSSSFNLCQPCPSGSYQPLSNQTFCTKFGVSCSPGSYISQGRSPTSDNICSPCPSGSFQPSSNSLSCTTYTSCNPGSYISTNGTSTSDVHCSTCVLHVSYQDEFNQYSCKLISDCPDTTFVLKENAKSTTASPCLAVCPPGTYISTPSSSSGHGVCSSCPKGTYADVSGLSECKPTTGCGRLPVISCPTSISNYVCATSSRYSGEKCGEDSFAISQRAVYVMLAIFFSFLIIPFVVLVLKFMGRLTSACSSCWRHIFGSRRTRSARQARSRGQRNAEPVSQARLQIRRLAELMLADIANTRHVGEQDNGEILPSDLLAETTSLCSVSTASNPDGCCAICMDKKPNIQIQPCKHTICSNCIKQLPNLSCPFCRTTMVSLIPNPDLSDSSSGSDNHILAVRDVFIPVDLDRDDGSHPEQYALNLMSRNRASSDVSVSEDETGYLNVGESSTESPPKKKSSTSLVSLDDSFHSLNQPVYEPTSRSRLNSTTDS